MVFIAMLSIVKFLVLLYSNMYVNPTKNFKYILFNCHHFYLYEFNSFDYRFNLYKNLTKKYLNSTMIIIINFPFEENSNLFKILLFIFY